MSFPSAPHFSVQIVVLFFSIVVHESAHGWMAERCGDNTARLMGRITLNPLAHIDPFGTILFPLLLYFMGLPIIGWAKPVPINPNNFYHPRQDTIKVGIAGPGSNILVAVTSVVLVWILRFLPLGAFKFSIIHLLMFMVFINLLLAVFNLLPVPPLDGSRIVSGMLPPHLAYKYDRLAPYGFIIIIFFFRLFWVVIIYVVIFLYKIFFWGLGR